MRPQRKADMTAEEREELEELRKHLEAVGYIIADFDDLLEHGQYRNFSSLHSRMRDGNLCLGIKTDNAWIARSGRAWSCHYGTHENIIKYMDVTTPELEAAGWIRVSVLQGRHSRVDGLYKPSLSQRRTIKDMGQAWHLKSLFWRTVPALPETAPTIEFWE